MPSSRRPRARRRTLAAAAAGLAVLATVAVPGAVATAQTATDPTQATATTTDTSTNPNGDTPAPALRAPLVFGTAAPTKANLQAQEAMAGRTFTAVRIYKLWGEQLFGSDERWMRDTYHTLFLSIKPRRPDGTVVPWADIAAATPGTPLYADMQDMASQIKAFGDRVFLTFSHEPEANPQFGTGPEYAAAWRTFVTVMRTEQVSNFVPTAIFTGYGFTRKDAQNVDNYYPGDAYVSVVGVDVYNWGDCRNRPWTPLSQSLESARQWGLLHPSIPLFLTEWGSVEDANDPQAKAQWITDSAQLLEQPGYEQFAGLFSWGTLNKNTACPFGIDTSNQAEAAWTAVGQNPTYSAWE